MVLLEDIIPTISNIIENAKSTTIFTNKCEIVTSILEEMRTEIVNFHPTKELSQEDLLQLQENFNNLSNIMGSFQKEHFFWSILKTNQSFQQTIQTINSIMSKINSLLQSIGIEKSFKLPEDNLYHDLDQIDALLGDTLLAIQQRRKEVEDYFKQIHKARHNLNRISTDEENIDELNKYPHYKVAKTDFDINPEEIDHNDEFFYYKGVKKSNNQNVTILKLRDNRIFKRLLSVLVTIDHPYVESFIGGFIEDKKITIVTNRDGIRLKNLLSSHKESDLVKLEEGDRTILAFKIAQAMAYLHSRSVIHRNLNTSHIFITKRMNDDNQLEINPTIVGFRDSCIQQSENSIQIEKLSSQKLSFFKAPELEESASIDEKVDVFAFSGILFEMLTGHLPFRNENANSVSSLLKENKRPKLPEDTPDDLRKLIENCWSSEPAERYSFDKIVDKMIKKKIIFQKDENKRDMIIKFYEKNSIKSINAKECLSIFDLIKRCIGKTYQYRFEFLRIRPILSNYHYILKTSQYSNKDELSDKEKENMESLNINLKSLSTIVTNQSEDKWSELLKKSAKARILMKNFDFIEVTNIITNSMNNIYESMINLGFDGIEKYNEKDDDLVFDYNELQSILEDYKEVIGSVIIDKKLQEIANFRAKRNLDGTISKESLHQRIKDLFSSFNEYEININDFSGGIDQKTGEKVFINELNEADFEGSEVFLFLLGKEIRYLTRLKHKYINEFIGFSISEKENIVWFVSKYVSDGSLFRSVISEASMSGDDKTKIAFQIAEAMNYMHDQRISHLDLKAQNVLLDGKTPKLINFKFSDLKRKCDMKNNTFSLGTVNYMAPEIIKGDKCDSKADVFSFAMMLYELYRQKQPFYQFGRHVEFIKKKILSGFDLKFDDDIQEALRHLILDCCQTDSEKRPAFKDIINRMRNENIIFPGAKEDNIKAFYADEIKKMELISQSHSFL